MSLHVWFSPLLSTGSRWSYAEGVITIRDGFWKRLLTLGGLQRTTWIDGNTRTVRIHHRRAWVFTSETRIPFQEVSHIDYSYDEMGTSWGDAWTGFQQTDQLESFRISVVAKDGREFPVAAFHGEGSVMTGWAGMIWADDALVDVSGTQEGDSQRLVNRLAKFIGVPLSKPIDHGGLMAACPACGRSTTVLKSTCLYCGSALP